MPQKKKIKQGLGKGLGALLPTIEFSEKGFKFNPEENENVEMHGSVPLLDVSKIKANPYQPRRDFDRQPLEDLKRSIMEHGVIQPITVRRAVDGYELIAGERRFRASKEAGFDKIPAIIVDVADGSAMLEMALIENVQREDLNPIEIAHGYQTLIEECNLTQEELSEKVGKGRPTIANFLRLLRLPEKIQESLRKKDITMGHARALLGLSSQQDMIFAWEELKKKRFSVRQAEVFVKKIESGKLKPGDKKSRPNNYVTPQEAYIIADTENKLRHKYGTKVKIQPKSKDTGVIEFEFYSREELERLLELFQSAGTE